jgi:hypothetical protein
MNCLDCQELLQKRLDGEPVAGESLEFHLSQCATCRERHAAALRLLEGLQHLPTPKPATDLTATLVASVLRDRRQRRERVQRRVLVTMGLAASILLMLLAAYWWIPRGANNAPKPPEHVERPRPAPEPKTHVEPKKHEHKNPLAALSERWADATRDHAKVVMVAANLDAVDRLPPVKEIPGLEAGHEVSDGVRTVTRGARRAFDFLARELPMPEVGEQKN